MLQVHITGTPAGGRGGGEEAPPPQIIPTRVAPARRPAGERAGAGRDVAGEPPAAWCEPRAPEELPCPAFRSPRALAGPRPRAPAAPCATLYASRSVPFARRRAPVAARCASFAVAASIALLLALPALSP